MDQHLSNRYLPKPRNSLVLSYQLLGKEAVRRKGSYQERKLSVISFQFVDIWMPPDRGPGQAPESSVMVALCYALQLSDRS